jgi:mRNA interferase RelE/StbE
VRARQPVVPPKVAEAIRHLPPDIKRAIRAALRALANNPSVGEPLEEELAGYWKYRVRRYRIIYRVIRPGKVLRILAVGERRSIYEEAAELLRSQK